MAEEKRPPYAWIDGQFVPYDEARIHVRTECVMAGVNVFEGVRAYWSEEHQELYAFRLADHMRRLGQSMKPLRLALPYSLDELAEALLELLRRCQFRADVHCRPTAYFGEGERFSVDPEKIHMGAFITAVEAPTSQAVWKGLRAGVSSWQRISDRCMPPRIKAGANYYNGRLAFVEVRQAGYDTPILLNDRGKVSEGWGSCLLIVRNGAPVMPPFSSDILESITRETLAYLCKKELDIQPMEREVDRTELYIADEVFLCGTAGEVTPITSVDGVPVGDGQVGPLTAKLRDLYFEVVRGKRPGYQHWLTPVYGNRDR